MFSELSVSATVCRLASHLAHSTTVKPMVPMVKKSNIMTGFAPQTKKRERKKGKI